MKKIRIKLLIVVYLLFAFISTINVKAEEIQTGKIGITYQYDQEVFTNRSISLYRVATQDEAGKFLYTDSFKGNDKIDNLTTSEWNSLALKLSEQVERNSIPSYDVKITDENGKVSFENIPLGLYLIKVEKVNKGDYEYLSSPILITLPNFDELANDYITEIETTTKTEERKIEKEPPKKTPIKKPSSNPYTNDAIMIYVMEVVLSLIVILSLIYTILKSKKKVNNTSKQDGGEEKGDSEDEQEKQKN